jgi:hypothetical protein
VGRRDRAASSKAFWARNRRPPSPIRPEEGKEDVIRREDIKNRRATNLSAMPADLEKQVSVREMADLLKYIKTSQ